MTGFLDKAYGTKDTAATRRLYDDWAASYDAEIAENGYATPGRCAAALAGFTTDKTVPILDFGCGTGLSGLALKLAGFTVIDGLDLSADMLAEARKKGIYRDLSVVAGTGAPPIPKGQYSAIAAIGVIGVGAAPIHVLDDLMRALPRGGKCVFSFNDHALQDPVHEARVMEWTDCGAARLLFREHGDHLPGIGVKSNVYVLEKA
ncbi:methyltransferase type 11 [Sulfitobacter sp. EhC04]|uniref:class I SAM-dependent DNA methyltransferase n=1 Tax=Sulfitobacter sp. EhC04 TaxID=1849168 RepID=UPI0007F3C785|nr:methyltransferase domain-containing protein [Sulfitobacter sp. EhC04]OAN71421.1 methyltransferase type 11 [Sulfitobacter sp. EhC04]